MLSSFVVTGAKSGFSLSVKCSTPAPNGSTADVLIFTKAFGPTGSTVLQTYVPAAFNLAPILTSFVAASSGY